jgi:membrane protein DedA with SNARE-associated domain
MLSKVINHLELLVAHFGSTGVFIASFIEEFFAPIPSGLVILSAGYGLMEGLPFTLYNIGYLYITVAVPVALGLTLGSLLWYGLAYKLGEPLLRKYGKYVGLSWDDVEKLQIKFSKTKSDEWVLFTLRAVPIIPSIIINVVAGVMRIPIVTYSIATFFGITVRASILGTVGWQLGKVYRKYADVLDISEKAIFILIALAVISYIVYKKKGK